MRQKLHFKHGVAVQAYFKSNRIQWSFILGKIQLFQEQKILHNRKFQDDFRTFKSVLDLVHPDEASLSLPACPAYGSIQMKPLDERNSYVPQELTVKMWEERNTYLVDRTGWRNYFPPYY